ncbi:hypothetical protein M422DRAFT_166554 [Sphaerobolus stellatus SS14]|uniref:Uncharacterized protein n=1 Tax=Sphaerobolus stellatus (strain SS14) TaxID=990650 RepID=A0A0C9W372_SPHS4|nr:hypothetical protein M422DRAFT_166554 [Sphaerobolus stellatus SS14]
MEKNDHDYTAFQQWMKLHSKTGEITREIAAADGVAMVNCIDWNMWNHHRHRMGPLQPSEMRFNMANNAVVPSRGRWRGTVEMGGCKVIQEFEAFDTKGAFHVLLG